MDVTRTRLRSVSKWELVADKLDTLKAVLSTQNGLTHLEWAKLPLWFSKLKKMDMIWKPSCASRVLEMIKSFIGLAVTICSLKHFGKDQKSLVFCVRGQGFLFFFLPTLLLQNIPLDEGSVPRTTPESSCPMKSTSMHFDHGVRFFDC